MSESYRVYRNTINRFLINFTLLFLILILAVTVSLTFGTTGFGYDSGSSVLKALIARLRFLRTTVAILTGGALGVAGLVIQTVVRNPLADPFLLGLSSTSLTFVALGFLLLPKVMVSKFFIFFLSFFGALVGYLMTVMLSRIGSMTATSLILAGIAVTSFTSGISHLLIHLLYGISKFNLSYMLLGAISYAGWTDLYLLLAFIIPSFFLVLVCYKPLNAYLFGDTFLKQIGIELWQLTVFASFISSLMTGITIACVGVVGFVGLVSPHVARHFVGSDHRFSIPASFVVGSIIMLISDITVRLIAYLSSGIGELPVGVITSVIGAPFMSYIVIKKAR
ncbi:MAG: iron ABC transporter permease [candidate division WOR-3 bacterium]